MAEVKDILVPDIGDFDAVEIIDIAVGSGDTVAVEDTLITLESDKATMDIPSPDAGVVKAVKVKPGDQVSQGMVILTLEMTTAAGGESTAPARPPSAEKTAATDRTADIQQDEPDPRPPAGPAAPEPTGEAAVDGGKSAQPHASPAVRKFARELGVTLARVNGSGRGGRITKADVMAFTKAVMDDDRMSSKAQGGFALPEMPPVDFSKFGPIAHKKLSRLQRLAGENLYRSWLTVPHVTHFDEADITELEEFRQARKTEAERLGSKLTLLGFLIKAAVAALKKYPTFNASLSPDGEQLILKNYYHIGFAVNTDHGLMVPVIKDADQKGLFDLAAELAALAQQARDKKLSPPQMQGGCFTISSLGHIGGTGFTPIVNTPEVAIMGVCRAAIQPVYIDGTLAPRLILPYSISYDHRVIDGVAAAEFARYLGAVLTDIRQLLL